MVISECVWKQFFAPTSPEAENAQETLIRLPPTTVVLYNSQDADPKRAPAENRRRRGTGRRTNLWTVEEHERFLQGLELFPRGPWKEVADIVGTKTVRQTMTHAQKYRQKIERMVRRDQDFRRDTGASEMPNEYHEENRVVDPPPFYRAEKTDINLDVDLAGCAPFESFSDSWFLDAEACDPIAHETALEHEFVMRLFAM